MSDLSCSLISNVGCVMGYFSSGIEMDVCTQERRPRDTPLEGAFGSDSLKEASLRPWARVTPLVGGLAWNLYFWGLIGGAVGMGLGNTLEGRKKYI
jgi:hypothetical protein